MLLYLVDFFPEAKAIVAHMCVIFLYPFILSSLDVAIPLTLSPHEE